MLTNSESGYQRIKIKIKPGKDVQLVEAIRSRFPDITLSVDANSAYSLNGDLNVIKQLDQYSLLMIEQPLAPGDLVDHAKLQREIKTSICLDESIVSLADAVHARELGSCRIINIKLRRVGGHTLRAERFRLFAVAHGIPVWCGGMLEAGIGRAHNIALSTLPGFTPAWRRLGFGALLGRGHHRAGGDGEPKGHDQSANRVTASAMKLMRLASRP